ncbi:MAG: hypothetical protein GY953_47850 [bacterium]|nr:hypothetical protein [bacterium]
MGVPIPKTAAGVLLVCLVLPATSRAQSVVLFPDGVASGDVTDSRAVLWTRTSRPATLTLEVSEDRDFLEPLQRTAITSEHSGLTSKVVLSFLKPDQKYFYRWRADESVSDVGSFRTAPLPWTAKSLRFVFAGDSDATNINGQPAIYDFKALDAARAEQPDFFIYLGDIVYTDSHQRGAAGRAETLDEFREAYRAGRAIPALRKLLQSTSTYPVWDDHEVANDWDPETVDPRLFEMGRQVFLEYMPLSAPVMPRDSACIDRPFFRYVRWGSAADFIILDERSCRSADAVEACMDDAGVLELAPTVPRTLRFLIGLPGGPPPGCIEAINNPSRTMIGDTQKWLLKNYLLYSTARFKFVVNEVAIQQYFGLPFDRWEGYAAERAEILSFIRDNNIENVIFLTADAHANMMNNVSLHAFDDPEPVAYEFVTGPIGTDTLGKAVSQAVGVDQGLLDQAVGLLGMECWDLDLFGYGLVEVDADVGTATVTLKDENGQVIRSKGDPDVLCTKTFQGE